MAERPALEGISENLNSSVWDEDDLREYLREVLDYAAALERQHAASQERAGQAQEREERWMMAVTHGPCKCDPPGSGEELCSGGCYLREERDALARELGAARQRAERLERYLKHRRGCGVDVPQMGYCTCGLAAAIAAEGKTA